MEQIEITAHFKIHAGQLDAFKTLAKKCLDLTRNKDRGTLQYDWSITDDGTECMVLEEYKDSASVVQHIGNLGDTLGALMGLADLKLTIHGDPSPELMKGAEGLDVTYYKHLQRL